MKQNSDWLQYVPYVFKWSREWVLQIPPVFVCGMILINDLTGIELDHYPHMALFDNNYFHVVIIIQPDFVRKLQKSLTWQIVA